MDKILGTVDPEEELAMWIAKKAQEADEKILQVVEDTVEKKITKQDVEQESLFIAARASDLLVRDLLWFEELHLIAHTAEKAARDMEP